MMKKPVVDYSNFSLKKLNDPEYAHLKLLGGWIVYFLMYFITENLIPYGKCHVIHSVLDDMVPFCEYFLIAYVFWFFLVAGSLLRYMLYDIESFKKLQTYIMVTQAVAMLVYILYPSIQDLRPAVMPRANVFCWILEHVIYPFDTPTGVFPSLHVAYSMGIASVSLKDRTASRAEKIFMVCAAIIISLSTAFVKQHSVLDILAAIPVGMFAEWWVFHRKPAGTRA